MVDEAVPDGETGFDPVTLRCRGSWWCGVCGLATRAPQGWTMLLAGPRFALVRCRWCSRKPNPGQQALAAGSLLVSLAIAALWCAFLPARQRDGAILWLLAAAVVQGVLHELAHAVAMLARRMTVLGFKIGAGPQVAKFHLGVTWIIHLLPMAAATLGVPTPRTRLSRGWLVAMYGAGLALHLAILVAAVPVAVRTSGSTSVAAGAAAVVAVGFLLQNALVVRGTSAQRSTTTDGTHIGAALRLPLPVLEEQHRAQVANADLSRLLLGAMPAELPALLAADLERHPSSARADWVRMVQAQALLTALRPADAREVLRPLLGQRLDPVSGAVAANLAAWCRICQGADLEQAHVLALEAVAVVPWDANLRHTLACAQAATGRPVDDVATLVDVAADAPTPLDAAISGALAAVALHRAGDGPAALQQLATAERKAPHAWAVLAAAEAIRGGRGPLAVAPA